MLSVTDKTWYINARQCNELAEKVIIILNNLHILFKLKGPNIIDVGPILIGLEAF